MNKIIQADEIDKVVEKIKKSGRKIVLAGGCFDILHKGHILFLKAAKKQGDKLFVFLESDQNISNKKGIGRPLNSIKDRSAVLLSTGIVDYIIPLNGVTKDEEYDKLILKIKPDIIAITQGDPHVEKRSAQCKMVGAKLKVVINKIGNISTTALINKIGY